MSQYLCAALSLSVRLTSEPSPERRELCRNIEDKPALIGNQVNLKCDKSVRETHSSVFVTQVIRGLLVGSRAPLEAPEKRLWMCCKLLVVAQHRRSPSSTHLMSSCSCVKPRTDKTLVNYSTNRRLQEHCSPSVHHNVRRRRRRGRFIAEGSVGV